MKVKCYNCGTIIDVTSLERPLHVKCPNCGTVGLLRAETAVPLPPPQYVPPPPSYPSYILEYPRKKKTGMPVAAGILLIIAGLAAIGTWLLIMVAAPEIAIIYDAPGSERVIMACGTIAITLSVISIVGGITAIKRLHWGLALTGSILGLFTIGPWIALSSIFSLIALILIAVSKEEFQ
ncbi:MAG: hypothetical protein AB1485_07775 [Candidatus Thermoplasmatota archaeon]